MKLKIDKAGRILLPKPLRERLNLHGGATLEVEELPDGIMLRRLVQHPSMIRKDGMWVHLGKLPRDIDWDRIVDDERDERIKDISGR